MSGMMLAAMASRNTTPVVINPVDVSAISDETVVTGAGAGVTFTPDGAITQTGNLTVAGPLWITNATAGIGSGYWIRLTFTGDAPSSGTTGTWLSLASSRGWTWSQATLGSKAATAAISIATDSGGTNIVASKTGISVSVLRTS